MATMKAADVGGTTAPTYGKGASGDQVILLQQLLSVWGINPGPVDGHLGPGTENAIKAFQTMWKLPVTGVADGKMISILQSQGILSGVKEGLLVPGMDTGPTTKGPETLNPDLVKSLQPPQPPPSTPPQRPVAPPAAPTGSGGGNIQGGGSQPPPAPPKPKTQAEIEAEVRRKYGSYAWMLDDPNFAQVRAVLLEGADKGWDDQALLAQLQNTDYFRTHDSNVRKYETLQHTDAATLNSMIYKSQVKIGDMAQKMGVNLDSATILRMAQDSIRFNWAETGDQAFASAIASEAQYKPDYGGDIGAYEMDAKSIARDYLMPIDDQTAFGWARDMAAGRIDKNTVISHFKGAAKGLLGPDYEAQIEAGLSPRSLLSSQINTISNLMEINTDDVDLVNDPRWQKILQYVDPNTGKRRPMTVSETSQAVKSTDDWYKTSNAMKEVGEKVDYLGKIFGKTV